MSKADSKGIRRGVLATRYGATRVIDAEDSEQDSARLKARLHRQAGSSPPVAEPQPAARPSRGRPETRPADPAPPRGYQDSARAPAEKRSERAAPNRHQPQRPQQVDEDVVSSGPGSYSPPVSPSIETSSANAGQPLAMVGQVSIIRRDAINPADALVTIVAPESEDARGYRSLLARIAPRLDRMDDRSALAFVSVGQSVKRSAVAANLAVLLAKAGRATCLVDVGLQNGNAASMFGLSHSIGLSEWLSGEARLTAHQFNDLDNFTLISGGRSGASSNERLMHPRFRDWLNSSFKQPGLTLLDATRVESSADAQAIASVVGQAVVILCKHDDRLGEAQSLVDELRAHGVNLIGSVFLEDSIA